MSSVMRFDEWQDSNGNPVASGVGGVFTAPGSVLQVVSTTVSTEETTSSASYVDTALTASITPSSTSSKIYVMCTFYAGQLRNPSGNTGIALYNLDRDSGTSILETYGIYFDNQSSTYKNLQGHVAMSKLDSPATTSSVTYTLQFKLGTGTDTEVFKSNTPGTLTLMEVAG